jgi:DNA-binding transcriptional LysR family regulator
LGVRLFNRTTRSVALTAAGERLLSDAQPVLDRMDRALDGMNSFRDKPGGPLRLCVARPIATAFVRPIIPAFLAEYPDIELEIVASDSHDDIISGRFDAGIHIGERIAKDMIAVRLLNEFTTSAVASPAYLARGVPPGDPSELADHNCLRFRSDWSGSILPWIFEKDERRVEVNVRGDLVLNDLHLILDVVVAGVGIGYLPNFLVDRHLTAGTLIDCVKKWRGHMSGAFLYYPSRRQMPAPLRTFIDFMRAEEQRQGMLG